MPTSQPCKNCQCTIQEEEKFCSICGQKKVLPPLSIRFLLSDFLQSLFSFDSKLPHTLIPLLFRPGKLTKEYLHGRRKMYFSPIKLFLFLLTVSILLLNIDQNESSSEEIKEGFEDATKEELYETNLFLTQYHINNIHHDLQLALPNSDNIIDSVFKIHQKVDIVDSIEIQSFSKKGATKIPIAEALSTNFDTLCQKYNLDGFWEKLIAQQFIKATAQQSDLTSYIIGQIFWGIVLIIPVLSFWLKFLYVRHKKYLIEHLVFLLHFHSFVFVLFIIELLTYLIFEYDFQWLLLTLPSIIYSWVALFSFYEQSWLKTTFKWLLFSIGYLSITLISITLYLLGAFLLF